MQRPRSMWWRLKRWKAVIKTWLPVLFPSRSMLDWCWVLWWALRTAVDTFPEPARKDRYAQIGPVMDIASSSNWADQWCSSWREAMILSHTFTLYISTYCFFVNWHYFSVFCFHSSFLYTMENRILNTLQVTLLMKSVSEGAVDGRHARSERWHLGHQRGG